MGYKIQMDSTQKILSKRYLNKNGQAQVKFTKLVAKETNNFVPFDTGRLKDIMVNIQKDKIIYNAPYARLQFYSNKGNGKQGTSHGGLRGKRWDLRTWNAKGNVILRELADFVGGRTE